METAISAVQATAASSQQNSQPDRANILAADVNSRQLMAVSSSAVKLEPGRTVTGSTAAVVPVSSAVTLASAAVTAAAASSNSPLTTAKAGTTSSMQSEPKILDKRRIADLLKEVDPLEQLDDDAEELLMQIADDFIDNVVTASCQLARHRKSSTVEVKDVQFHLERHWNMWIPGFGSDEVRPYKRSAATEAHKQRLALIKKTLKKS